VGYKLLIEPRISLEEFEATFIQIGEILSQKVENNDSSEKKLIYQIPFAEVEQMSSILEKLESICGEKAYIDVEMNSLEDAYLNIARAEEKHAE